MTSSTVRAPKTETRWRIAYEIDGRTSTTARFDSEDFLHATLANNIDDRAENVRVIVETSVTTYREVPVEEFVA